MDSFSIYMEKLLSFLRATTIVGGLEVSDSALRFAYFDGRKWQMIGIKLSVGIVQGGKVLDEPQFVTMLERLKQEVTKGKKRKEKIPVVLSLSSIGIYTQVFSLPVLKGSTLEEAIDLNVKMVSPMDQAQVYSGYQVIGEDESSGKVNVLTAFIGREVIETFRGALSKAGFLAIAVESKPMSLVRLIRQQGVGVSRHGAYIAIVLDNENLDFIVIRDGQLYFEYVVSWAELKGSGKEISLSDFRDIITRNLRQVSNYYSQHWPEKVQEIILVAVGLQDEVKKIVADNFSLSVKNLDLRFDQPIAPEWFFSLGGGLRSRVSRAGDQDLSLLGLSARDEYRHERIESFFGFWRVALPSFLGILIISLSGGLFYLMEMHKSLDVQAGSIKGDARLNELSSLQEAANGFNRDIDLISSVRSIDKAKLPAIEKLNKILVKNGVTITRFVFRDFNVALILYGETKSRSEIGKFKEDLGADPMFKDIRLSLTDIKEIPQGFSFSVIFSIASPKAE